MEVDVKIGIEKQGVWGVWINCLDRAYQVTINKVTGNRKQQKWGPVYLFGPPRYRVK